MKTVYKLEYRWHEGEHLWTYIITDLEIVAFKQLLVKGINEISDYPEADSFKDRAPKTFVVRCLPSAYDFLIEYLEENGCDRAHFNNKESFEVDDGTSEKFIVDHFEETWKRTQLK